MTLDPTNSEIDNAACYVSAKWLLVIAFPYIYPLSKFHPHTHTQILVQYVNCVLLSKDCLVSSQFFEFRSSFMTLLFLQCTDWCHLCRHKESIGSPNRAFPLGLRVRGLILLSCHTLFGMLSVLWGTDAGAYLQSRPVMSRHPRGLQCAHPPSQADCAETKWSPLMH